MDLREARREAVRRRYRDLCDSLTKTLPKLLDDLEAIDRAHVPSHVLSISGELTGEQAARLRADFEEAVRSQPVRILPPAPRPADEELAAWIEAHPDEFAAWVRKRERTEGAPAKPARTRRPRGGAAT